MARETDCAAIMNLIRELALYEKAPEAVINNEENLLRDGFGADKRFTCFVAEQELQIIGIALFYNAYSTWKGRYIYLDDIVVTEKFRRGGVGKKLFDEVIHHAESIGANQLRWHVLEWNTPAIEFYRKYKASLDEEWIQCKLEVEQINSFNPPDSE